MDCILDVDYMMFGIRKAVQHHNLQDCVSMFPVLVSYVTI